VGLRYNRFYYKPLPDSLTISASEIEGLGVFAVDDIEEGFDLRETHIKVPMILGYIRTPLGGFVNHSEDPNCYLTLTQEWDDYFVYSLFSSRNIERGEELTLNYDE
jgi:SET domain-containing protein